MSIVISEYLVEKYGFKHLRQVRRKSDEPIDYDKFSCILRIHEIHYLFYSDLHKYFSIGVRHQHPKGLAGGGKQEWTCVMLPKVIKTTEDADLLINGIL